MARKRFSERMGLRPMRTVVQLDSMDDDLRTGLWNIFYALIVPSQADHHYTLNVEPQFGNLAYALWLHFFKQPIDRLPRSIGETADRIRQWFFNADWDEAYDFIEFVAQQSGNSGFVQACNRVLEDELSGYRFIGSTLTPISSEEEMTAVEDALTSTASLTPVYTHLREAVSKLAERKAPDFRNSIKESISAVEALANMINESPGTLGETLKKIDLDLHPALKKGFNSLYGWTSDDQGIRHALMEEPNLHLEDAKFMLVSCSAFINYLISKASRAGMDLS